MGPGTVSLGPGRTGGSRGGAGGAPGESCTARKSGAGMSARAVSRPPRQRPAADDLGIPQLRGVGRDCLPMREVSVGRPLARGPATVQAEDAPTPSIAPPWASPASPLDPTGALPALPLDPPVRPGPRDTVPGPHAGHVWRAGRRRDQGPARTHKTRQFFIVHSSLNGTFCLHHRGHPGPPRRRPRDGFHERPAPI
jgi:hypothetical protein